MLRCSRTSLEHTTQKNGFSVGAFRRVEFAQDNEKIDALARVSLFASARVHSVFN